MADEKNTIRKTVAMSPELWQRVEDWQHLHRIKRDTEAFRQLIELGLKAARDS